MDPSNGVSVSEQDAVTSKNLALAISPFCVSFGFSSKSVVSAYFSIHIAGDAAFVVSDKIILFYGIAAIYVFATVQDDIGADGEFLDGVFIIP